MRSGWLGYFSMVPDYTIEVHEAVAEGSLVIVVGTVHGTYSPEGKLDPVDRWSTPDALRAIIAEDKSPSGRSSQTTSPFVRSCEGMARRRSNNRPCRKGQVLSPVWTVPRWRAA